MKRNPITFEEHLILGQQLVGAVKGLNEITWRHPASSRVRKAAERCLGALITVRSELNNDVCVLTAGCDPRNMAVCVYYGGMTRDETQVIPGDAFAGWNYT